MNEAQAKSHVARYEAGIEQALGVHEAPSGGMSGCSIAAHDSIAFDVSPAGERAFAEFSAWLDASTIAPLWANQTSGGVRFFVFIGEGGRKVRAWQADYWRRNPPAP